MSIYFNIWEYKNPQYPVQFFIGARGYGKTYSALDGAVMGKVSPGNKFIYMRRTEDELELLSDGRGGEGANPFKPINDNEHTNYGLTNIVPHLLGIYHRTINDDGGFNYEGAPIGYGVALSTISKIRSLSFEDCSDLIYDECIPELHVRKMSHEFDAFMNALETINRNREFNSKPPINVWCLANSNNIYNALFVGLGIVSDVEKMLKHGKEHKYYPNRGLAVHILKDSNEFTERKQNTMVYKLAGKDSAFSEMALHNTFSYNDFDDIGYRKLKDYQPLINISNCCLYKRKGGNDYYVSYATSKHTPSYKYDNKYDRVFLRRNYMFMSDIMSNHLIIYESYELKEIFTELFIPNKN